MDPSTLLGGQTFRGWRRALSQALSVVLSLLLSGLLYTPHLLAQSETTEADLSRAKQQLAQVEEAVQQQQYTYRVQEGRRNRANDAYADAQTRRKSSEANRLFREKELNTAQSELTSLAAMRGIPVQTIADKSRQRDDAATALDAAKRDEIAAGERERQTNIALDSESDKLKAFVETLDRLRGQLQDSKLNVYRADVGRPRTAIGESTVRCGDDETPRSCRDKAEADALRQATESASTVLVQSFSEVRNFQLTEDRIRQSYTVDRKNIDWLEKRDESPLYYRKVRLTVVGRVPSDFRLPEEHSLVPVGQPIYADTGAIAAPTVPPPLLPPPIVPPAAPPVAVAPATASQERVPAPREQSRSTWPLWTGLLFMAAGGGLYSASANSSSEAKKLAQESRDTWNPIIYEKASKKFKDSESQMAGAAGAAAVGMLFLLVYAFSGPPSTAAIVPDASSVAQTYMLELRPNQFSVGAQYRW